MKITVVISAWQVPFDQVVFSIQQFDTTEAALAHINEQSKKWWDDNEGDRCRVELRDTEPYEPIKELGYNHARYVLWDGEVGFHAMIDRESYAALHEAHYKREFDSKGHQRPGYLLNAYAGDNPVGQTLTPEQAEYRDDQLAKIALMHREPKGNA